MEKVRLGRTNLTVRKLGWGGIPIQRVGEREAVSVIQDVIEMGVELLDTARSYTNSEHRIGRAVERVRKPVVLSTKSLVRTVKIYDDIHESLKRLRVKKIDIYHLHNITKDEEYEKAMGPEGAYEGLKRARAEGLIDYIGLTSHSLSLLEKAIEEGHFDVIMACYSFLEPDAAKRIFPLAKARDIGVLTMKPFSGGVIEEAGPALRYIFSTPDIVAIPGTETLERAKENWKIYTEASPLTDEDQKRIEAIRNEFDRRFCRRCDYCQPCSQHINIQGMMGFKALVKRLGAKGPELDWIKSMIATGRSCTECGDCLPRCPYQLPIPELIKENLAWYDSMKEELQATAGKGK